MTARKILDDVLSNLPDDQVRRVLEYAQFLTWRDERDAWHDFGLKQFARGYADDEPEYSLDDIKERHKL